ncbi:hypothetical protein T492DRAFT_862886 [Pavlovales sp. CCMP2436]|nr:hypothetical protein T492DRAFT_862886 [Pavlovales sp. CCMP2436]
MLMQLCKSAGSDEEENAAALGLIAQFVRSASTILNVQLQHPLDVRASRSHVLDRNTSSAAPRQPELLL